MACSTAWIPAVLDVCSYKDAERGFPQSILSLSSQSSGEARAGCAGAFLILFICFHPTPQNRLRSKDRPASRGQLRSDPMDIISRFHMLLGNWTLLSIRYKAGAEWIEC